MIPWIITLSIILVLWLLAKLYLSAYHYWEKKGFPFAEGRFPFGSDPCLLRPKRFSGFEVQTFYNKFKGELCGGIYNFRHPELIVCDPKLIKNILVKDFSHFEDRLLQQSTVNRPLSQQLFAVESIKWRHIRTKLTPTFTSGKLKLMYCLFEVCCNRFEEKLREDVGAGDGIVNIKDMVARLTTDIIASCAFGLDMDSIHNPQDPLRKSIMDLFAKPNALLGLREQLYAILPNLRNWVMINTMPKHVERSFIKMIADTINYREEKGVRRNDFLDLLLDLKKDGAFGDEYENSEGGDSIQINFDLSMMAAQSFVFFVAGFETSSTVQTFAFNELAYHQDVQNKLRKEIEDVSEQHGGINYQSLKEMKYLDQVVNETMRKYPTLHSLTRVCTRPYTIPGTKLVIDKKTSVIIPVYSLHHDPEYFPEPEKFDPDRFSEGRKSSIVPFTYLPFGEGPRNCIGMRFGLLQTKLGIATVVKHFRVLPSQSSMSVLEFTGFGSLFTKSKNDIKLQLQPL